jgi:hypothetical protein
MQTYYTINMPTKEQLAYYKTSGPMTQLGDYATVIADLPDTVAELVAVVQASVIHQFTAEDFYGVKLSKERIDAQSNIRHLPDLFDAMQTTKKVPLGIARKPDDRLVGVCHHFAVMLVGLLRAKGIPARARYGFGDYFNPGFYEDHSLCEYWHTEQQRWVLVDPQFDGEWQKRLHITHDILDVPRDHFLIAGTAWQKCRSGELDANTFGIFNGNLRGLWFVADDIVRDIAALNKYEMLQWDSWGIMPQPDDPMGDDTLLAYFDHIAQLTLDPDTHFNELQEVFDTDKFRVGGQVFNAMRQQLEQV